MSDLTIELRPVGPLDLAPEVKTHRLSFRHAVGVNQSFANVECLTTDELIGLYDSIAGYLYRTGIDH